jgi:hypothetical protein
MCRLCKQRVRKGEVRIVTHTFVRPGRSHDFVKHLKCATPALVAAMVGVQGSVGEVPGAKDVGAEGYEDACAQLRRVEGETCTTTSIGNTAAAERCSEDTCIDAYDPWNIVLWKDRGSAFKVDGL